VPLERASLVFGSAVISINSQRWCGGIDLGESAPTVSLMPGGARRQRLTSLENEDRKVRNLRRDNADSVRLGQ
jgi:hypothetical protein